MAVFILTLDVEGTKNWADRVAHQDFHQSIGQALIELGEDFKSESIPPLPTEGVVGFLLSKHGAKHGTVVVDNDGQAEYPDERKES